MKVKDLIRLYRLDKIDIRIDNYFVLSATKETLPDHYRNREVYDFCFSTNLVINLKKEEEKKYKIDQENMKEIDLIRFKTCDGVYQTKYREKYLEAVADVDLELFRLKLNEIAKAVNYLLEKESDK